MHAQYDQCDVSMMYLCSTSTCEAMFCSDVTLVYILISSQVVFGHFLQRGYTLF